jgi:hypothetical protein
MCKTFPDGIEQNMVLCIFRGKLGYIDQTGIEIIASNVEQAKVLFASK